MSSNSASPVTPRSAIQSLRQYRQQLLQLADVLQNLEDQLTVAHSESRANVEGRARIDQLEEQIDIANDECTSLRTQCTHWRRVAELQRPDVERALEDRDSALRKLVHSRRVIRDLLEERREELDNDGFGSGLTTPCSTLLLEDVRALDDRHPQHRSLEPSDSRRLVDKAKEGSFTSTSSGATARPGPTNNKINGHAPRTLSGSSTSPALLRAPRIVDKGKAREQTHTTPRSVQATWPKPGVSSPVLSELRSPIVISMGRKSGGDDEDDEDMKSRVSGHHRAREGSTASLDAVCSSRSRVDTLKASSRRQGIEHHYQGRTAERSGLPRTLVSSRHQAVQREGARSKVFDDPKDSVDLTTTGSLYTPLSSSKSPTVEDKKNKRVGALVLSVESGRSRSSHPSNQTLVAHKLGDGKESVAPDQYIDSEVRSVGSPRTSLSSTRRSHTHRTDARSPLSGSVEDGQFTEHLGERMNACQVSSRPVSQSRTLLDGHFTGYVVERITACQDSSRCGVTESPGAVSRVRSTRDDVGGQVHSGQGQKKDPSDSARHTLNSKPPAPAESSKEVSRVTNDDERTRHTKSPESSDPSIDIEVRAGETAEDGPTYTLSSSRMPKNLEVICGPMNWASLQHRLELEDKMMEMVQSLSLTDEHRLRVVIIKETQVALVYDPFTLETETTTYFADWGTKDGNDRTLRDLTEGWEGDAVLHTFMLPLKKPTWYYVGAHVWKPVQIQPLWPTLVGKSKDLVTKKLRRRCFGRKTTEEIERMVEEGELEQMCVEISSTGLLEQSQAFATELGYRPSRRTTIDTESGE